MDLLVSNDPRERSVGADVLAQLGWEDKTFLEESVDALLRALRDPDDSVVQAVIFALGHRESPRAIEPILAFVVHSSGDLRYAAVHGLMPHDTPIVVEALAKLSRDVDRDVRDWSTFALGSQFDSDSSTLRAALHDRVNDTDPEVRGEALVGLARRRDASIADAVQRELEANSTVTGPLQRRGIWVTLVSCRHSNNWRSGSRVRMQCIFEERWRTRSLRAKDAELKTVGQFNSSVAAFEPSGTCDWVEKGWEKLASPPGLVSEGNARQKSRTRQRFFFFRLLCRTRSVDMPLDFGDWQV